MRETRIAEHKGCSMVSIVNGYVCFNCTDTEKAQKGVDPANPTNDPLQNKSVQQKKDEAHAILKAEVAKSQRIAASGNAASGQSTDGQASAGQGPAPVALLPPGVGDLVDASV
jgi:hypothetical protein